VIRPAAVSVTRPAAADALRTDSVIKPAAADAFRTAAASVIRPVDVARPAGACPVVAEPVVNLVAAAETSSGLGIETRTSSLITPMVSIVDFSAESVFTPARVISRATRQELGNPTQMPMSFMEALSVSVDRNIASEGG
jgi:hypothetical protein